MLNGQAVCTCECDLSKRTNQNTTKRRARKNKCARFNVKGDSTPDWIPNETQKLFNQNDIILNMRIGVYSSLNTAPDIVCKIPLLARALDQARARRWGIFCIQDTLSSRAALGLRPSASREQRYIAYKNILFTCMQDIFGRMSLKLYPLVCHTNAVKTVKWKLNHRH